MTNLSALELDVKQRQEDLLKEADRPGRYPTGQGFGHAIVIGGSVAGLITARVLADHFARVTIIERDRLPETAEFRRGAPQARHAHTLQRRGQAILEELFPGLTDELVAAGAIAIDPSADLLIYTAGDWRTPRHGNGIASLAVSRPLLESTIYRRVVNHPQVAVIRGQDVVGLLVDERGEWVAGVQLHGHGESAANLTELAAETLRQPSTIG